jgi:hypothetical protein
MIRAQGRSPRPVLLHPGRELQRWIADGGRPERFARWMRFRLRWSAYWFEKHAIISARQCAATTLPPNPTFIVGLWRTGSTALHELLAATGLWTSPVTYQCFRPAEFLLVPQPKVRSAPRPMDERQVGTLSPQEDEFAALLLGEPSLYRAFLDPRRLPQLSELLRQWHEPGPAGAPTLSDRWESFLKAVLQQRPGPLLLKSPNHTFRLPWLAARFPSAQFIWLTRARAEVLESNQRMWGAMFERYGLWRCPPGILAAFLEAAFTAHDEVLHWAENTLPERLHRVTYDELRHRPAQVSDRLAKQLLST